MKIKAKVEVEVEAELGNISVGWVGLLGGRDIIRILSLRGSILHDRT